MRVLMLGWELPPFISGGLGTACHGLTRAMARLGARILFVLPRAEAAPGVLESVGPSGGASPDRTGFVLLPVPSRVVSPYPSAAGSTAPAAGAHVHAASGARHVSAAPGRVAEADGSTVLTASGLHVIGTGGADGYGGDLIGRIAEYAARCEDVVRDEAFDVIHAHDWVTFPAGLAIAARHGKPLVVHVHSTEFDRSGERVNPAVCDIERAGMRGAAAVIAVSNLTKGLVVERYGVPPEKVRVVYNGLGADVEGEFAPRPRGNGHGKVVLFLGRLTMQKGPEFFVRAAGRVLEKCQDVKFIMAGWGDLGPRTVEQVTAMGLGSHVRFTGFLRGEDVHQAYRMADVYVMPSVSEPFGLTALEAIQHGVPVVLSRSSGVAEVLPRGALKVDFWDVDQMADKVVALLRRPEVGEALRAHAAQEVRGLTWTRAAQECMKVYGEQMEATNGPRSAGA